MYEWRGHQPPRNGWRFSRERMQELHDQGLIWYPDSTSKRPQFKRYLDEQKGVVVGNVWTDIPPINARAAERLGYPTQKPLALLERIIEASTNEGDVVLDPFCGCGTAVDAAQKLGRRWIGIDVTWLAIDVIENRLAKQYGAGIGATYEVLGIPKDIGAAKALFERDPFEFERWAVSLLDGQPNDKQRGDKGVDGVTRFTTSAKTFGKILISVKGGGQLNPSMVRDLIGTVDTHRAALGALITLNEPTRGMIDAARHSGLYTHPGTGNTFGRIQVVTISQLLDGHRPPLPALIMPYVSGPKLTEDHIPAQPRS